MPALIDLRRRIKSVKNPQQITQAMKTVSTAKFKKSQRAVLEARPHWHNSPDLLSDVVSWAEREVHPLCIEREEKKIEGLVITSDKGLCGAFNSNLLEKALSFFEEKAQRSQVNLVLIGKKALSFFRKQPFPVDRVYSEQVQDLTLEDLKELAQFLMRHYVFNRTDAVYVAYNEYKSILSPRVTVTRLLPLSTPEGEAHEVLPPDWEPEADSILNSLLHFYIESQIRHFYFESQVSEHAARMMAMDNATRNAEDLISDLTMVLNKIRQASITEELLEIMTAVEALTGK
ncbi:MAG TPA: ATP synthase F1 subunit gamma [Candidatus Aminicenantes bacterium]|nr:ATP synthase F1 subunit gamma [Candidatus Aminicenantes bacterium]